MGLRREGGRVGYGYDIGSWTRARSYGTLGHKKECSFYSEVLGSRGMKCSALNTVLV